MRAKITILCTILLLLFSFETVAAKGPPGKLVISGPGLKGELVITDSDLLDHFWMNKFVDFDNQIDEPRGIKDGYEIVRYYPVGAGLKAIDKFVYYPHPGGEGGYIFYDGIIDKMFIYGGSPFDGHWFNVTEEGDPVIREILEDQGVRLVDSSTRNYVPGNGVTWLGYGGLIALAGILILLFFHKHTASRSHSKQKDFGGFKSL